MRKGLHYISGSNDDADENQKRATFLFRQAGLSYFIGRVKDSSRKRDKKELKFKHEEVSANRKELEESSAKIRDAASSL